MSLYNKYRPKTLKQIVGQEASVLMLKGFIKKKSIPHAILFHGPSGCGKTTFGRILKTKLNCSDFDFSEQNAASNRGIDDVRKIESTMRLSPMGGSSRVYLIDEAHRLTNDAQSALLKMLEDTPQHVYFMLATTDPQKLLPTVRSRCTDVPVKLLDDDDMDKLIRNIQKKEKQELEDEVIEKIVECAEGSPRKGIVLLESVLSIKGLDERIDAIQKADEKRQAIELCRLLVNPRSGWQDIATIAKDIPVSDIESFRHMVLSYATSMLIGAKDKKPPANPNPRAYVLIEAFRDHWYDCGRAGLVAACLDVWKSGRR